MEEQIGRIIRTTGGLYTIRVGSGDISCRAKGAFRHEGQKPLAGDMVALRGGDGEFSIGEILPRKNALIRPPLANLDYLFVVTASAAPDPVLLTLDKLIAIAEFNRIEPVIVITKDDLDHAEAQKLRDIYAKCGFDVFITSPGSGACELLSYIKNKCRDSIIAFAGSSGVGKSTLMNALFPALALETGSISVKTERGKHTTRAVELYSLSELLCDPAATGWAADTPGFSMLDFVRFDFMSKDDLPDTFREFRPYLGRCRYNGCTHTVDEGCAVLEALRSGEIPPTRHQSFLAIRDDLKNKHSWD